MVMADIFVVVRNVQAAAYCRESSFLGERKLLSYRETWQNCSGVRVLSFATRNKPTMDAA